MSDRKVKVREIADILKISAGSVHTIIHEHLGMKKVFSKWVPRLLTPEQKQQRIDESKSCLDMFTRNKSEFLRRYITMDETWIHHFTPESNRQSAEWHAAGESRPKRPKSQQLAGKVMASVFWDAHGIIFIDYLQKGQTINSDYYMALLERLKDEIAKKRPHMAKKKVLFHQDNAPCHKSMKTMAKLNELGFELLPHPPYSPDLAPSDYWLFADLKKMLRVKNHWKPSYQSTFRDVPNTPYAAHKAHFRRYKIPTLVPPKLKNSTLTFSESARYLGLVLDRKQNWNLNIQERFWWPALTKASTIKQQKNGGDMHHRCPEYDTWLGS
ncbi:hypothetical protein ACLKA7_004989 [Drosophila subpalustris]